MSALHGVTLPPLDETTSFVTSLLQKLPESERLTHEGVDTGDKAIIDEEQLAGGLSADTRGLTWCGGKYVLKRGKGDGIDREVAVYRETGLLPADLTVPFVTSGASEDGVQHLVMADARADGYSLAGLYFGASSPLNYGKDLPDGSGEEKVVLAIAGAAAAQAGALHGRQWGATTALADTRPWLRVSPGAGDMKESDIAYSNMILGFGRSGLDALRAHAAGGAVKVTDELMADADASLAAAAALLDPSTGPTARSTYTLPVAVTLVHGDFHPGNQLWNPQTSSSRFVDLEQVGLGSGPQEIGQYLISHLTPEERATYEGRVTDIYVRALQDNLPAGVSVDEAAVRREVIVGGYLRWLWLLGALGGMVPPMMLQGFIDKMQGFRDAHKETLASASGMPVRL
jgi:hypothetical protein